MAGSLRLIRGVDVWELRVFVGRDSRGRVRHVQRTFRGSWRAARALWSGPVKATPPASRTTAGSRLAPTYANLSHRGFVGAWHQWDCAPSRQL